jgi:hypothetical protein
MTPTPQAPNPDANFDDKNSPQPPLGEGFSKERANNPPLPPEAEDMDDTGSDYQPLRDGTDDAGQWNEADSDEDEEELDEELADDDSDANLGSETGGLGGVNPDEGGSNRSPRFGE